MKTEKIYLTGFMTSGKSTLGPILANCFGWDFYDLDDEIEKEAGKSVNEIFENEGAEYFRKLETKILKRVSETKNCIVALGGGAVANDENIKIIKSTGKLIYLRVEPEIIYRRIRNKFNRPLFYDLVMRGGSKEEFLGLINSLLEKRKKYYEQADLKIDVQNDKIGYTVDRIANIIRRTFFEKD